MCTLVPIISQLIRHWGMEMPHPKVKQRVSRYGLSQPGSSEVALTADSMKLKYRARIKCEDAERI